MSIKTTGLDSAPLIPVGAVLDRVSWHVPSPAGHEGREFDTERAAIEHAVHVEHVRMDKHNAQGNYTEPVRLFVDLRWHMKFPSTYGVTGMSFVARRSEYAQVGEAIEHLNRIDLYAAH